MNDRKITADGKEGPGDRSGEAYPCNTARRSPATMEARHSPHTTMRPHN
uniref:Anti-restriction protein n=1 Tax=Escherichia coli TaxID=562 RepID=A0A1J0AK94_ECOLX|nr:Putative Anti-restriction protein [Escherichia coli]